MRHHFYTLFHAFKQALLHVLIIFQPQLPLCLVLLFDQLQLFIRLLFGRLSSILDLGLKYHFGPGQLSIQFSSNILWFSVHEFSHLLYDLIFCILGSEIDGSLDFGEWLVSGVNHAFQLFE